MEWRSMKIIIEDKYIEKYFEYERNIFKDGFWSDGNKNKIFEKKFGEKINLLARSVSSGGAGLYSILKYIDVEGMEVILPTNTFIADAYAIKMAGGKVVYADCNREDLCISFSDMKKKITHNTKAVVVVHIGGHIAFQINEIADYCKKNNIFLIEDCAHAHGASWYSNAAGSFGFAGFYSFYATKIMPIGEGGMVVSKDEEFIKWIEKFRNYGKNVINGKVIYDLSCGFNFRMNEFNAALGIVQLERLDEILDRKRKLAIKYDQIFENRVRFPKGMISGYYKYIVFDTYLSEETGKVFGKNDLCHSIEKLPMHLPNSEWIAEHHRCVPIYDGYEYSEKDVDFLKKHLIIESY